MAHVSNLFICTQQSYCSLSLAHSSLLCPKVTWHQSLGFRSEPPPFPSLLCLVLILLPLSRPATAAARAAPSRPLLHCRCRPSRRDLAPPPIAARPCFAARRGPHPRRPSRIVGVTGCSSSPPVAGHLRRGSRGPFSVLPSVAASCLSESVAASFCAAVAVPSVSRCAAAGPARRPSAPAQCAVRASAPVRALVLPARVLPAPVCCPLRPSALLPARPSCAPLLCSAGVLQKGKGEVLCSAWCSALLCCSVLVGSA